MGIVRSWDGMRWDEMRWEKGWMDDEWWKGSLSLFFLFNKKVFDPKLYIKYNANKYNPTSDRPIQFTWALGFRKIKNRKTRKKCI